jgi:hypothetical protein
MEDEELMEDAAITHTIELSKQDELAKFRRPSNFHGGSASKSTSTGVAPSSSGGSQCVANAAGLNSSTSTRRTRTRRRGGLEAVGNIIYMFSFLYL